MRARCRHFVLITVLAGAVAASSLIAPATVSVQAEPVCQLGTAWNNVQQRCF